MGIQRRLSLFPHRTALRHPGVGERRILRKTLYLSGALVYNMNAAPEWEAKSVWKLAAFPAAAGKRKQHLGRKGYPK
jgi:hypothetical protein